MKHLILVFWVIGSVMIFFSCQEESTFAPDLSQSEQIPVSLAKPSANLIGTTVLDFNLDVLSDPTEPAWVGTITFEGNKDIYGVRFFSLIPPRDFSQASPFEENFEIYAGDIIYMTGHDEGVTTLANSMYRANGEIEVANEPFEDWLGCMVHMSGIIYWQTLPNGVVVPETAEGTFRIN